MHRNYLRGKVNGPHQKWEERYKAVRETRKAKRKAELEAASPKYAGSQFNDMRLVTRSEADMPEGMIGYEAEEVIRKVIAAKGDKIRFNSDRFYAHKKAPKRPRNVLREAFLSIKVVENTRSNQLLCAH